MNIPEGKDVDECGEEDAISSTIFPNDRVCFIIVVLSILLASFRGVF
jgi:hypothetical protein